MSLKGVSERFYAVPDSDMEELGVEQRLLVGVKAIFDLPSIGSSASFYSIDCNGILLRD